MEPIFKTAPGCRLFCLTILVAICAMGCSTFSIPSSKNANAEWSLRAIDSSKKEQPEIANAFRWTAGNPQSTTRVELILPRISEAAFDYQLGQAGYIDQLSEASAGSVVLTKLNKKPVQSLGDVVQAVSQVESHAGSELEIEYRNSSDNQLRTAKIDPLTLDGLIHAAISGQSDVRVATGEIPQILSADQGLLLKLQVRADRASGILNLMLALSPQWGEGTILPVEITATCDGQALQCLSVDDTLQRLYDPRFKEPTTIQHAETLFSVVAEREGYLLPTKYAELANLSGGEASSKSSREPAFASIHGGEVYPGTAILGDARALTAFLLQKQIYASKTMKRTGWVVFGGSAMRSAHQVKVQIDVGNGTRTYTFDFH